METKKEDLNHKDVNNQDVNNQDVNNEYVNNEEVSNEYVKIRQTYVLLASNKGKLIVDRGLLLTKGQWCGRRLHAITSSLNSDAILVCLRSLHAVHGTRTHLLWWWNETIILLIFAPLSPVVIKCCTAKPGYSPAFVVIKPIISVTLFSLILR